ncbi:Dolichyl-phosphate-mannose-protein mannosyltransferase-domain-containing protein [Cladochytrium replicatum]|nr:Dolichyl-phosphate-mannose-protein mannosyltransferase-domain-containing protein [Cladochytrium replicatum]
MTATPTGSPAPVAKQRQGRGQNAPAVSEKVGAAAKLLPVSSDDKIGRDLTRPAYVTYGLESNVYAIVGLTILAGIVRLFRISHPAQVVFDEVHFGGFASKYIKGKFFMDVHPPLGKLLIAAAGVLAGFNGDFDFKEIGKDYLEPRVPYVAMRLLPGILGVLLVPIAYITMRNAGFSNTSSLLAALLLTFENGSACQSRLILLDSILVFFTGLSAMMWTDFLSNQDMPFSFTWWYPLFMTGVSIGLAASVKWVGLFVIATVGVSTIQNLWELLGDVKRVSWGKFIQHFLARALCLIVVPLVVYTFMFQIHFSVLPNNGSGNGFMSPEFQATLNGNAVTDTFKDVSFGSKVMLRHGATNGGYLHSHNHFYPGGSKQQQVTCYPFRDENSSWELKPALVSDNGTFVETAVEGFVPIKNGDIVRLEHTATKKRLHSHDVRGPVTDNENHNEASCYGAKNFVGDTNDHFRVEIVDGKEIEGVKYLYAIESKFRLIHINTGCQLFSHAVKLPEWGFGQQEVLCSKNGRKTHTIWRIESNVNELIPQNSTKVNYAKPGFFAKFGELHKKMWTINAGLTGSHPFDSRPDAWPFLRRGISFWSAKTSGPGQIYLIGNPLIWWTSTVSVLLVFAGAGVLAVLAKRKTFTIYPYGYLAAATRSTSTFVLGWALHYLPFFLMGRQLFLHHYFPALYFSILTFAAIFDIATFRLPQSTRSLLALLIVVAAVYVFIQFAPLTYGTPMTKAHCEKIKWLSRWDWDCRKQTDGEAALPAPIAQGGNEDVNENQEESSDI